MAQNKVIAGDYEGKNIMISQQSLFSKNEVYLFTGFTKKFPLNKETVSSYELVTEEHRKSAVSGVGRGLVGGALLGPVGLLAGLSAKNKGTHTLVIEFEDGKRSLIEINEKIYKLLMQKMF
ncbi:MULTISPECIES: hypothetical protein [unclassified Lysinibacillus]|uniref:hypothetical protein n=1 Tax=unclassified Lysinibacillus TaxID=2636778 RepID=UPI0038288BB6